jgi:inner membrane protein
MDNVTHTLAGAVLAEAGLARRTRLGTATLLIGANLPDVDALSYLKSPLFALTARRGWTHGILAMAVLPFLLAAAMVAWDRWRPLRSSAGPLAWPRELLVLAAIGIWSHPLLDLMNSYGVRLLMPFSERWFYADTLFIVDPWLLLILGAGVVAAHLRRRRMVSDAERPARVALAVAAGYVAVMMGSGVAARRVVAREASGQGIAFTRRMVAPVPVTPFRRDVILDLGDGYRRATFDWRTSPHLTLSPDPIPRNFSAPAVAPALDSDRARAFFRWSRFPAAEVDSSAAPPVVRLYDLRYAQAGAATWAGVELGAAGR